MTTFLIAHTNSNGTGIAQCEITADVVPPIQRGDEMTLGMSAEENARRQFAILYPERGIHTIGVKEGH